MSLFVLQAKVALGLRQISASMGLGEKRRKYAGILLLFFVLAFVPFMRTVYQVAGVVADASLALNQPGLPIVLGVTGAQFLVLFMTISHLMSTLFYGQDLETLRAMPLRPHQIVLAKIGVVYLFQFLISLIPGAPFIAALGLSSKDVSYWFYAFLMQIFVPGIPVALSLFGVLALMRFTRFSARRDLLRVVLGLLFFFVIIGFQLLYTRAGMGLQTEGPQAFLRLLSERQGLIRAMTRYYPPLFWSAMAVAGRGHLERLGYILLFGGVSVLSLLVVARVTESWFFSGERREMKARGAKAGWAVQREVLGTQHSPEIAIFLRDVRILTRTPNFFMVALMNLTVFPLLLLFGYVASRSTPQEFPFPLEALREGPFADLATLGIVGVHALMVGLNQIPSAAISREGRLFWVSKVIPVDPPKQLRAKLAYSLVYGSIQALIMLVIAFLVLRLPVARLLWVAVLALAVLLPVSVICLLVDLFRPKLDWTEPHQAMKGNFGTFIAGLISSGYVVGLGFLMAYVHSMGLSGTALYVFALALLTLSGALLYRLMERWAKVRYEEIE
ncbi:MAG TPA: hypothetical protein GX507_05305 [Clostridia bacterium]|nr:hypothetical protein [Clostridia bacterium]